MKNSASAPMKINWMISLMDEIALCSITAITAARLTDQVPWR